MSTIPGYTVSEILAETKDAQVLSAKHGADRVLLRRPSKAYPTPDDVARLRYGAAISQSLDIAGVVRVTGVERQGNSVCVVMEDFGARTLRSLIDEGPVEAKRAVSIALSLSRTLGELHRSGVVHKAVEPLNVYVNTDSGTVKLANFDLASRVSHESPTISSARRIEGAIAYISPEQTGRMNRAIDHRTDFYSLGVTLYEMLTGELPFHAKDPMALVHCHIAVAPEPPSRVRPSIPEGISSIVMKLLAKNAEDRYQSAYGLGEDLRRALTALEATGTVAPFVPGEKDVSSSFHLPDKLYGRAEDEAALLSAFASVSRGAGELALVSGYSGVGKSALVNEIQRPLVEARGYFCSGKFDQLLGVPYGAILQAFGELVRHILSESEEEIARWRERILAAVGPSGAVVSAVIPEVERIIGPQPPVPALGPSESENRFNLVFLRFVDAFARREHPLVIFLDDLQWADSGSLNLMALLLKNAETRCLFLIGAYRDNEVSAGHPLMLTLAGIRKGSTVVTEISLRPLDRPTTARLVADALGYRDPAGSADLAALVFQKTAGNPFFIKQFLTVLHEKGLLTFDPEKGRWRWSIGDIQAVGVTDNVATLMAERLLRLPEASQRAVRLAACIGSSFDLRTLSAVSERGLADTGEDVWGAIREGLVVPEGEGYKYLLSGDAGDGTAVRYTFLHDRVQEAAYATISEDSRKEVHLQVGRLLLRSTPAEERDKRIFDIVDQLDRSLDLVASSDERREIAHLNLLAGRRAKASTAYASALGYLTAGEGVLAEGGWQDAPDLMRALHRETAECLYLLGRFDEAEAAFNRVLGAVEERQEKAQIHALKATLDSSRGRFPEAQRAGREALALYGIELPPPDGYGAATGPAMGALMAALAGRSLRDLASAPEATDPDERMRIRLLANAITFGGYVTPELFGLLAVILVRHSCLHGNAPGSAIGYMAYGVVLNVLGNHIAGFEAGQVSLEISERFDSPGRRGELQMYYATLVNPWQRPVRAGLPLLEKAYVGCLEDGVVWVAAVCSMFEGLLEILVGEDLEAIRDRTVARRDVLDRLNQQDQANLIAAQIRAVTLLAQGSIPAGSPAWMEDAYLRDKLGHFTVGITTHRLLSLMVACIFGDHARAVEIGEETLAGIGSAVGHVMQVDFYTYHALALAGLDASLTGEAREKHRALFTEDLERLRRWAAICPENFLHKQLLLEAELCRLEGKDDEAVALFDQAIASAAENEYVQFEALGNELCGKLFLAKGRKKLARAYLADARYAYRRWGAEGKVRDLEARHEDLLPHQGPAGGSAAAPDAASLDLTAVMKASQAISEEIVLDELLQKLMSTVLENAGAQRALLVLAEGSPAIVEAEKTGEGQATVTPKSRGEADFSRGITRYVERTLEVVVLGDAVRAGQFRSDEYVLRARPRSVLCMPIIKQKKLVGLLYLENGLVADAFTPERCRVLDLLAAQAAISLENARLYDTLDQRVKDRTRELRESNEELSQTLSRLKDTQRQLIVQEKLASLGTLTSGIAHEIRNPLNFVNNFAELTIGLSGEISAELRRQSDKLDPDARESLEEMAADLRQSSAKIQEHGARADAIVRAMLEHAGAARGERRQVDLNALVREYAALVSGGQRDAAHVAFVTSFDPELPPVEAVPQDLGRVFLNVIHNACYAALAKRKRLGEAFLPEVRITTRTSADRVEVHIRDNGDGIPAPIRDKIYTPFFTTKPPGEGTGLGLSISYDIVVQGNGGALSFETEEGRYAEFVVALPVPGREPSSRGARPEGGASAG